MQAVGGDEAGMNGTLVSGAGLAFVRAEWRRRLGCGSNIREYVVTSELDFWSWSWSWSWIQYRNSTATNLRPRRAEGLALVVLAGVLIHERSIDCCCCFRRLLQGCGASLVTRCSLTSKPQPHHHPVPTIITRAACVFLPLLFSITASSTFLPLASDLCFNLL
jgi:hypothetical protein